MSSSEHIMRGRILSKYNLIPLLLVPATLWGLDLLIHFSLGSAVTPMIWISVLTLCLPVAGYFLIIQLYKHLLNRLPEMLLPEIPGLIGFLYSQSMYMIVTKLVGEGFSSISFKEAVKTILTLTPIVPISTIMISTYGGSLLAVPLTCLTMILAGYRCRRKSKAQSV